MVWCLIHLVRCIQGLKSCLFLVNFHRLPPGITWYAIEMWENQTKNLGMGSRAEMGMCRFGVHHKVYWMVLEAMLRSAYKKVKSNSTTLHTSSWPISMNRCFKASYPFLWDALTCRSTLGSRVWSPCDVVILKGFMSGGSEVSLHPRPRAPSSAGDPRKVANSCWLVGAGSHPAETPGGAVFGGETRSFKGLLPGQGLEVQERELWARDPSADKKKVMHVSGTTFFKSEWVWELWD